MMHGRKNKENCALKLVDEMHGRKNKENCALKLVDEIILYYDARSKKHQIKISGIHYFFLSRNSFHIE